VSFVDIMVITPLRLVQPQKHPDISVISLPKYGAVVRLVQPEKQKNKLLA